ncbi:MAG: RAMP superfamily CRISPR-associated protein [Cyanobacteria bacterium J06634_5]
MHKRFVNHCTIQLTLKPDGPILIKSGREGADPTKPDMEFVDTYHDGRRSIYLPGSSLKGAIRAHAERIVRTVGSDRRPDEPEKLWASDPLDDRDKKNNPNNYLEEWKKDEKKKDAKDRHPFPGAELYRQSCFATQLFGSTSVASRLRIEDAYPKPGSLKLEERNGVAIDRVFGSVAVGPFNYQVCTAGEFTTKIHLKNFTLAQLGLIGLVLRDLNDGWFGIGFAKSRGLGTVSVTLKNAVVQYPGCKLDDKGGFLTLNESKTWSQPTLLGAGEFIGEDHTNYGFQLDEQPVEPNGMTKMDLGLGVQLSFDNEEDIKQKLFTTAVNAWKTLIPVGRSA